MKQKNIPLKEISKKIDRIDSRIYPWWKMVLMGTLHGIGAVIGAALVIAIVGFVLNVLGYFPVIGDMAKGLKLFLENYSGR